MKNKTKTPGLTKESKRKHTLTSLFLFNTEYVSSKKFLSKFGLESINIKISGPRNTFITMCSQNTNRSHK